MTSGTGLGIAPVFAAVIAATACSSRSVAQESARIPHRATTAPMVRWFDNMFVLERLPAVARSANIAVVPLRENDAGRGFPNLRIEIRDRGDKTLRSIEVMNSNEFELLAPTGTATPALSRRIALANLELQNIHAARDLVEMQPLPLQASSDGGDPHVAIGDGIAVDWRTSRLDVHSHPLGQALASVDSRPWLAPPQPSCAACDPCENPAFLSAVYYAAGIPVVVAQISYRGSDACWEPSDQFHVVTW